MGAPSRTAWGVLEQSLRCWDEVPLPCEASQSCAVDAWRFNRDKPPMAGRFGTESTSLRGFAGLAWMRSVVGSGAA
jgi:hypothetical protein